MAPRQAKLAVAALLLCGAGLVSPARATLTGAAAQEPRVSRIVSLVPAVTEILFAIGAGSQVVAVSSYDEYPPEVKALPRVGALLDPNVEAILALRPQLVVSYGSQSDLQLQLRRAGIAVLNYRHAGLEGVFATIGEAGTAAGRRTEAERLARGLRAHIARVRARVGDRRRPRALLVFERDPSSLRGLFASGGVGFLHDMLETAGGANVFADVKREAVQPSHEMLLTRAPEVVIELRATGLITVEEAAREERSAWAALPSIPAVRNRRVHVLNGDYLLVPGPRVGEAIEAFARALHPDAFR